LIGTPYEVKDCWGIIRDFFELHGINVEEYYKEAPNDQQRSSDLISVYKNDFKKVQTPEYGDIILINLLGFVSHCAVYIGDGKMLHSNKNINCVVDKVSRWEKRIEGYYRIA
jgi:cell wall-associated NlpC family hydrolase